MKKGCKEERKEGRVELKEGGEDGIEEWKDRRKKGRMEVKEGRKG